MKLSPKAQTTLILLAAGLAAAWYFKRQAGQALESAGRAVNPTDQENLANRGFNSVYQSVTGSEGSLGTDLAGWLSDDDEWAE